MNANTIARFMRIVMTAIMATIFMVGVSTPAFTQEPQEEEKSTTRKVLEWGWDNAPEDWKDEADKKVEEEVGISISDAKKALEFKEQLEDLEVQVRKWWEDGQWLKVWSYNPKSMKFAGCFLLAFSFLFLFRRYEPGKHGLLGLSLLLITTFVFTALFELSFLLRKLFSDVVWLHDNFWWLLLCVGLFTIVKPWPLWFKTQLDLWEAFKMGSIKYFFWYYTSPSFSPLEPVLATATDHAVPQAAIIGILPASPVPVVVSPPVLLPPAPRPTRICSNCNARPRITAKSCNQCGENLERRCSACDAALRPTAKSCNQCGKSMTSSQDTKEEAEEVKGPKPITAKDFDLPDDW